MHQNGITATTKNADRLANMKINQEPSSPDNTYLHKCKQPSAEHGGVHHGSVRARCRAAGRVGSCRSFYRWIGILAMGDAFAEGEGPSCAVCAWRMKMLFMQYPGQHPLDELRKPHSPSSPPPSGHLSSVCTMSLILFAVCV